MHGGILKYCPYMQYKLCEHATLYEHATVQLMYVSMYQNNVEMQNIYVNANDNYV